MPDPIVLGAAPEAGVPVQLWEHHYTTRPITRSVQAAIDDLEGKVDEATDNDTVMSLLGDLIAAILVAVNGAPPAADLIREKWLADELAVSQLSGLANAIKEAANSPS